MVKIAIIGSLNMDYVIETEIFPKVGETVLGKQYEMFSGGKGANQAVAASRLGGDVTFFGSVGSDNNGNEVRRNLRNEGINIENLQTIQNQPTGTAFIEVSSFDNRIVVVPGANTYTNDIYAQKIEDKLKEFDIFVFQLETPMTLIEYLIPKLYKLGKKIICNPAPAKKIDASLLEKITYIIPNEHEIINVMKANSNVDSIIRDYPFKLIVTLGDKGVMYFNGEKSIVIPTLKVKPVDTTGAGDTFIGAFSVAISEGKKVHQAIEFANLSSAISVTTKGAQAGMPLRKDIETLLLQERAD